MKTQTNSKKLHASLVSEIKLRTDGHPQSSIPLRKDPEQNCKPKKTNEWLLRAGTVMAAAAISFATAKADVTIGLAWDPSPDPSVISYNLYQGSKCRNYTNVINVPAPSTFASVSIKEGTTSFFCVTALSTNSESPESGEISYSASLPPTNLITTVASSITPGMGPRKPSTITFSASAGVTYELLASQNAQAPLSNWTVICTYPAITNGNYTYTDVEGIRMSSRYYMVTVK